MAEVIIFVIILLLLFVNATISLKTLKTLKSMKKINEPTQRTSLLRNNDGYPTNTEYPIKHVKSILNEEFQLNTSDVVLIFTSVTCDVCRKIYPILNEIEKKYQNISFVFLMQGQENTVKELTKKYNIRQNGVILLDYDEMDKLGIKGFPFAYFLKNGIVKNKGLINYKEDFDILLTVKT